jgi:hypothetical protein
MSIERINHYIDERFSETALLQHGAYLVDDQPYQVVIVSDTKAVVSGDDPSRYLALIDEFRFHAPHVTEFVDGENRLIASFPPDEVLKIGLHLIQPSQFFVDEEKVQAVSSFVKQPDDIVIQVIPYGDRYIAADGHTRLYLAHTKGFDHVRAVVTQVGEWLFDFVKEANQRGIYQAADMKLLSHKEYEVLWNQYCDDYFAAKED